MPVAEPPVYELPSPVGLVALLGGFAAGLALVAGVVASLAYLGDPGSPYPDVWFDDGGFFLIIGAVVGLSAAAGAIWHLSWLNKHLMTAGRIGIVCGVASALVFAFLAALSAWKPDVETAAVTVGRFFMVIGPGTVVALVVRARRRKNRGQSNSE